MDAGSSPGAPAASAAAAATAAADAAAAAAKIRPQASRRMPSWWPPSCLPLTRKGPPRRP